MLELLKERGASDIVVFGGGIVPAADIAELERMGVAKIFTPGASTHEIVELGEVHARRPRRVRGGPTDQLALPAEIISVARRVVPLQWEQPKGKGELRETLDSNERARRAVCVRACFLASQSCPG